VSTKWPSSSLNLSLSGRNEQGPGFLDRLFGQPKGKDKPAPPSPIIADMVAGHAPATSPPVDGLHEAHGGLWIFRVNLAAMECVWSAKEWGACDMPLLDLIPDSAGVIDDYGGALQVDFANAFVGGGVLSGGCVQEEIRFAQCPDLVASCLICEAMRDGEAVILRGGTRYSKTRGYAFGLQYDGPFTSPQPDPPFLTAIDACDYRGWGSDNLRHQLDQSTMLRELEKARAGFSLQYFENTRDFLGAVKDRPGFVATGHWGCGAFLGNKELKALEQWMAASACGMCLQYSTFKDLEFAQGLSQVVDELRQQGTSVGRLWSALASLSKLERTAKLEQPGSIFSCVKSLIAIQTEVKISNHGEARDRRLKTGSACLEKVGGTLREAEEERRERQVPTDDRAEGGGRRDVESVRQEAAERTRRDQQDHRRRYEEKERERNALLVEETRRHKAKDRVVQDPASYLRPVMASNEDARHRSKSSAAQRETDQPCDRETPEQTAVKMSGVNSSTKPRARLEKW